eukprot:scaffold94039_cov54-Attheya_sp.AAC.1
MCGNASASSAINPMHVDFQPSSDESTNKFKTLLLEELEIRDMLSEEEETLEDMRQRLKLRLTIGIKVRRLRRSVK